MTIRENKQELEKQIHDLIESFEEENTDVYVSAIEMDRVDYVGGDSTVVQVKADIRLR